MRGALPTGEESKRGSRMCQHVDSSARSRPPRRDRAACGWRRGKAPDRLLGLRKLANSMGTLQRLAQLLGRSPQARVRRLKSECTSLGEGATVQGSPFVENEGTIRIGRRARLSAHLGPTRLRTGAGAELRLGDDADIGFGAVLSASREIVIGDRVSMGPY